MLLLSFSFFPNFGRCSSDTPNTLTINSDIQYNYAQAQFNQHDFQTAIVEFNRFIYFFPDDKRVKEATLKKGISLFHTKKYGEAIGIFRELILSLSGEFEKRDLIKGELGKGDILKGEPLNIEIIVEAFFMLSTTFLVIERYASAEMVLHDLILLNDDIPTENRAFYALAWIYLAKAEKSQTSEKEALKALAKAVEYIDKMTLIDREQYNTQVLKKEIVKIAHTVKQRRKNPLIAGIASIIPGGGFAYCNRYKDAVVSFLLNSAFMFAAVESFDDENRALGGLISFVGFGFYGGSIYGGISSAHKYNKNIIRNGVENIRILEIPTLNIKNFNIKSTQLRP